ncbi:MAG TPA: hypothetical protein VHA56_20715 [Mucilaginibacter sp.]|nr:hypothetical protein [Mucilaginibacter sp.]
MTKYLLRRTQYFVTLLSVFFSFQVLGQGVGSNVKLEKYLSDHPAEQAYLHFDRPYYAAGDTIYFKAYVTMGERHLLSKISGVLHVDLINIQNKIDQSLLLKIHDGVAWGDFALPDTLPQGIYKVRAYTRWMRNSGEAAFFKHAFMIRSMAGPPVSENAHAQKRIRKPDFQFFPEGGDLVVGLKSKVAFKAVAPDGSGINVKGKITDNTGKTVSTFQSTHLGMGYFELMPEKDKTYRADLTFADGAESAISLPVSLAAGISLTVDNDSLQKTSILVRSNDGYFQQNKDKAYHLVVFSGGLVININFKLVGNVMNFDLPKRRLKTGVNTVTLFSATDEPLCERLFFIQNYDDLSLKVSTDKVSYLPREKVTIKINSKNRADSTVTGHFSVSVTDETKAPFDENNESTILSYLLLTGDLKGAVEQPNYYFSGKIVDKLKDLDLVMLTHGYRRFEWKSVLTTNDEPAIWQPERNLEIAGNARTLTGRTLVNGKVSLIAPFTGMPVFSGNADKNGDFRFVNLDFPDSSKFILQAVTAKGKNNTMLNYTPDKPVPVTISADYHVVGSDTDSSRQNHDNFYQQSPVSGKMLKEVKIKARKITPTLINARYGLIEQQVNGSDIKYGGLLADRLTQKLRGIHFATNPDMTVSAYTNKAIFLQLTPMTIVLDGQEMPKRFDINSINTGSIDNVGVITDPLVGDGGGVIIINTIKGAALRDIQSTGILPITVKGYYKAREFYSPKYEDAYMGKVADSRSTIYWNPEVVPDRDGNMTISFYNADGRGVYKVVVDGMDEKGNPGRQVYRYSVK